MLMASTKDNYYAMLQKGIFWGEVCALNVVVVVVYVVMDVDKCPYNTITAPRCFLWHHSCEITIYPANFAGFRDGMCATLLILWHHIPN